VACDVSVVIPTWQRREAVRRLLQALERTTFETARFEVIVAVDGSSDGTVEMLETLSPSFSLSVRKQANRGRAAACNLGVGAATGRIVVLLDDDMEPAPGFLSAHAAAHANAGAAPVVAVGPVPIERSPSSGRLVHYRSAVFEKKADRLSEPGRVPRIRDVYTGNVSFPRSLFTQVGGFDEAFRIYGHEDFELLERMTAEGAHIVWTPQAVARQYYDKTLRDLARDVRAEGETAVLFATKRPEAFDDLELATWSRHSTRHRAVLTWLLRSSVRWPSLPDRFVSATALIERLNPPFLERCYDMLFDYLYWVGATQGSSPVAEAFRAGSSVSDALEQVKPSRSR
jgi:GT2 family glycosyltransferase